MSAVPQEPARRGGCNDPTRPDDALERAQGGDPHAFEVLYRRHVDRIHGLCLRMVRDPHRAEGLTQDVFVKAWTKLQSYRGAGSFEGWLYRLAVRLVIEDIRKMKRSARWLAIELEGGEPLQDHPAAASPPPSLETAIDLERAVAELPPGARCVFLLHDVEGYAHREIAELTGSAVGTTKAQLHRARRLLRRALGESGEEAAS